MAGDGGQRGPAPHRGPGWCTGEGQEADFVVLDPSATPLLARRTAGASLSDTVFAMQVLGNDRTVSRTYVIGGCAWDRDSAMFGYTEGQ